MSRVLGGFLYGVAPTDPASMLTAAGALMGMGVIAALAPAVRAGHTSPVEALRSE